MPNSFYNIHVIQVYDDQPLITSQLALFLENKASVTYDLPVINTQTTNYSRRRIDACDFVILLVGDNYGETNLTGVSQLHLSYLAAKTKDKPMLVMMKSVSNSIRSRQMNNFIDFVEQRGPQTLYYYRDSSDFEEVLKQSYEEFTAEVSQNAWFRLNEALGSPYLQSESLDADSGVNSQPIKSDINDLLGVSKSTKSTLNELNKINLSTDSAKDDSKLSDLNRLDAVQPIKSTVNKGKNQLSDASIEAIVNQTASGGYNLEDVEKYAVQEAHAVSPNDITTISYSAHAYQDGNLSDVTLKSSVSWKQLLKTLGKLGDRFSSDAMYRCFNEEVSQSALQSVVKILPNVHAVSRCMIEPRDFAWIKEQLEFNGWLDSIEASEKSHKEFWALTAKALNLLGTNS